MLLFSAKKKIMTPFLVWRLDPQNAKLFYLRFYQFFFSKVQDKLILIESIRNFIHQKSAKKMKVWSWRQNLGQIRSNVVKKQRKVPRFFPYFAWGKHFKKHEVVGIEIPKWKLKSKLARNTYHIWRKLGLNFSPFWVRNSKKWLFKRFSLRLVFKAHIYL